MAATGIHDEKSLMEWLCKDPLGKIVLCNILAALKENLLDKEAINGFMKNYYYAYTEDPVETVKEVIRLLEDVARGNRPIDPDKRRSFQLQCPKTTPAMNGEGWLSTVMEVGTLSKRYIDDSELAEGHTSFLSNPDSGDSKLQEAIEGLNTRGPDIYKANARLGGKPERPLFWITHSEVLADERHRLPAAELADAVRDKLGLIHIEQGTPLAEIRIPRDRLRERRHARPTFADAGDHRRFRTTADGSREKRRSGWGCTVCLKRFKMDEAILDGAPERVVEPTNFNVRLGVGFAYVGFTRIARGTSKNDDREFAERLCDGASCSEVITAILDHLQ